MKTRKHRFSAVAVAVALVVTACGGDDEATPTTASTTAGSLQVASESALLRVGWPSQPGTLDPHKAQSGDKGPLYQIYDSLIASDPQTLEAVPSLAVAWTFEEPTRLVLQLREGVTFHDGTAFNADAVRYNIERGQTLEGSTVKSDLSAIETVEIINDLTLALVLSRPDVALIGKFDDRAGLMVSPTSAEELGDEYGVRDAVGTGPFVLTEWRQGERAEFSANVSYWQPDQPGFRALTMRFLEDPSVAIGSMLAGELDVVFGLDSDLVQRVEGNDDFKVVVAPSIEHEQIYFNMTRPPLDDVRVRRAINMAINREEIAQVTTGGLGEVAWMPFPSTHWAYVADIAPTHPFDPDAARLLLEEAGYGDGFTLTAATWPDPARVRRAEIWQANLANIGINVELSPMPLNEGVAKYFEDEQFDLGSWGWGGRPDPNQTLSLLYRHGTFFHKGIDREDVNALLEAADAAGSQDERITIYSELLPLVTSEYVLNAPLHFNPNIVALRAGLQNFRPNLVRSTARLGEIQP